MIFKIILKIAVNAGAVYSASILFDGVSMERNIVALALVGTLLWLGNAIVRPIIKLLTFPLILLTFGVFNIIINVLILWGVDILVEELEIAGIVPLLLTTLLVSVVSSLFFFL